MKKLTIILLAAAFLTGCSPLTKGQAIGLAAGLMLYKAHKQDSVNYDIELDNPS